MSRIYLAGPDVFLPDAVSIGAVKKRICAAYGLVGVYPMDLVPPPPPGSRLEMGLHVYDALERGMRDCDAIVADLTPYHGPSIDPGTAFEIGFMRALGRPVFAYSGSGETFLARMTEFWRGDVTRRPDGSLQGRDGTAIEDFDMADNLMLHGCVVRSTGVIALPPTPRGDSTASFEACIRDAAEFLRSRVRPSE